MQQHFTHKVLQKVTAFTNSWVLGGSARAYKFYPHKISITSHLSTCLYLVPRPLPDFISQLGFGWQCMCLQVYPHKILITSHLSTCLYLVPRPLPNFITQNNREKAWDHSYVMGWKWWTRSVRNMDWLIKAYEVMID